MAEDLNPFLPLSPAVLHILLALASEDRHEYGIMQEIAPQSVGRYKLGPATMYENLEQPLDRNIVDQTSPRIAGNDSRRRYCRMTKFGRSLLSTEIGRLESVFVDVSLSRSLASFVVPRAIRR
jgi:DNA-binding PadR family transcriptional regulator